MSIQELQNKIEKAYGAWQKYRALTGTDRRYCRAHG